MSRRDSSSSKRSSDRPGVLASLFSSLVKLAFCVGIAYWAFGTDWFKDLTGEVMPEVKAMVSEISTSREEVHDLAEQVGVLRLEVEEHEKRIDMALQEIKELKETETDVAHTLERRADSDPFANTFGGE